MMRYRDQFCIAAADRGRVSVQPSILQSPALNKRTPLNRRRETVTGSFPIRIMPAPGPAYIPSAFEQLISDRAKKIIQTLHDFIYDEVMPTEKLFEAQMPADRWSSIPPVVEELKKKAKALGLWNLFLHKGYKEGPGLTNLEYAIMAELTGLTRLAPEVRPLLFFC